MNGELNSYLGHAGQALKNKIIDTSPIDPNAIEGLSDNDKRKLEAFNSEVADLRKRHKRSSYTEDFIQMATWVLTGIWEMPKHPFTLSQGATWGHEFIDDLHNREVLVKYKKGRRFWIQSAFTPEAQEKIKAYLEAKEKQFQYDNRGRISGRNYGIVENK